MRDVLLLNLAEVHATMSLRPRAGRPPRTGSSRGLSGFASAGASPTRTPICGFVLWEHRLDWLGGGFAGLVNARVGSPICLTLGYRCCCALDKEAPGKWCLRSMSRAYGGHPGESDKRASLSTEAPQRDRKKYLHGSQLLRGFGGVRVQRRHRELRELGPVSVPPRHVRAPVDILWSDVCGRTSGSEHLHSAQPPSAFVQACR